MSDKYFIDTNIIIYLFSETDIDKKEQAKEIIKNAHIKRNGIISYQVIQEFCNVALRKFKNPLGTEECKIFLNKFLLPICEVHSSNNLYNIALDIKNETNFSFYDCLILAGSYYSGCKTIFTEDMNEGQIIKSSLKIINPFEKTC
jgi:predicted nucleic acid-binding protein